MYPVSNAFRAAVGTSYRLVGQLDVLTAGNVTALAQAVVVGGEITVDSTAATARHGKVIILAPGNIPASMTSLYAPAGNEVRVWRGIQLPSGPELVPIITGGIYRAVSTDDNQGLQLELDVYDRSRKVAENQWTAPYTIAAGTNLGTAIQGLITDRLTGVGTVTFNFVATTTTTPLTVLGAGAGSDPWSDAVALARSGGYELLFDPLGICVLRSVPDPLTSPVDWAYVEGSTSTFSRVVREMTREQTYNGVLAVGENVGSVAAVSSLVWDTNPASPSYYLGPFGKRPTTIKSPLITTVSQAQAAAQAELTKNLGATEVLTLTNAANPAHDLYDVVTVQRTPSQLNGSRYLVRSFRVPLGASVPMELITRARRLY